MKPKLTSAARSAVPLQVVLVTMDPHLASAAQRARDTLLRQLPGLIFTVHAAADWGNDKTSLNRCIAAIESADIVIATMLFMEEHFQPVLPALAARRDTCDAMVCIMSAPEVTRLTRLGRFTMDGKTSGPMALLKKLKPKRDAAAPSSAGAQQMKMLRRIPQLLKYVPGTAQDVRIYFLCLQYWLAGSQDNINGLVQTLIDRYASGEREVLRGLLRPPAPVEYPEVGLYHPQLAGLVEQVEHLPRVASSGKAGTVGLLLMRSYLLAGNAAHYAGVITALEARGLRVIPAFASGLDAREAIDRYFMKDGRAVIDAMVSMTGFSLVGGPAYNDAQAAEKVLAALDVPYVALLPVEFQTLEQWRNSERGLLPVEATMMVAIPELDGATGSMVFGGRVASANSLQAAQDMQVDTERADSIAARVGKLIALRKSERASRKLGLVIFNFPPNAGAVGTAAFLSVFESVFNTLKHLKSQGYTVELPENVEALRVSILEGNRERYGSDANVLARVRADDHVRREKYLAQIEAQWGPSPGKLNADGQSIHILGAQFGNVAVVVQPGMGIEGDPMRLLFDKGFVPTHAFSAFYRYLREDFAADALLHFGTHGALEFMPGKQSGLCGQCWPDRLIGDVPNFYLYAANNPSEGTLAKRRACATLISYLSPPLAQADLYNQLADLKAALDRWQQLGPAEKLDQHHLLDLLQGQAVEVELASATPCWTTLSPDELNNVLQKLDHGMLELQYTLIPHGLHVVGQPFSRVESEQMVQLLANSLVEAHNHKLGAAPMEHLSGRQVQALLDGQSAAQVQNISGLGSTKEQIHLIEQLQQAHLSLMQDSELEAIVHALDGNFVRPAPGGDLQRTPEVLPTGRNLHGFDPFRIPSRFAVMDGERQTLRLLDRYKQDSGELPETIAMVLWGTDNLKSEGAPIAQALALIGAQARFDTYGRLAGAQLVPLALLGRPRIDVMMTLSGIFRDLLPLQIKLLAQAALLAAKADEPTEQNFIRKHALAYQAEHGGDIETAALRVFGNADGAYGANVSLLIDNSRWQQEDELAETFSRRKGFAYGVEGQAMAQPKLLASVLAKVNLAYQNLDSVELGVTTIDTYFDTLGGISRAIARAKGPNGTTAPVYIGDQTTAQGTVRTLSEQVALETRTRMLNPKFYEGLLEHGFEGVRQLEVHLTNTLGWSATTGQVQPWVYQQLTQTFMLDPKMRDRLAQLNPTASARFANRLLEASERKYWQPDEQVLKALRAAGEELEDRLEGAYQGATA
jgi:magnesium chelatase subunit H